VRRVLDSSALLTGRQFPGDLLIPPSVLPEVQRHGLTPQLEAILETQVDVCAPSRDALRRAREAGEATGDAHRLSPTDIDLVALAIDVQGTVVTDDYSIQNIARALGIPFEPVMERGIREQWTWSYRCTGCRAVWPEWHDECPTCGAALRTARPRRQPR